MVLTIYSDHFWSQEVITLDGVTLTPSHLANKTSLSLDQGSLALHSSVMLLIWCLTGGHSDFQSVVIISQVQ